MDKNNNTILQKIKDNWNSETHYVASLIALTAVALSPYLLFFGLCTYNAFIGRPMAIESKSKYGPSCSFNFIEDHFLNHQDDYLSKTIDDLSLEKKLGDCK